MIDYSRRLERIRAQMVEQDIGLMFLMPGANLFYLTGIRRQDAQRTDTHAHGDWAVGGYIYPDEGIILVAPHLGVTGSYINLEAEGKPWFEAVHQIWDDEDPLDIMRRALERFEGQPRKIAIDDRAWAQTTLAFRRLYPDVEFVLASELIAPMRSIKEEAELALMKQAGMITVQAFQKVMERLKVGVTEFDIAAEIDYQFRAFGADFNSFVSTIRFVGGVTGGNTNAQRASGRRLTPGDSVTFDIGCVYQGYCSDFGRSAYVGAPPQEFLRIHDIVLSAQLQAAEAMKAGQTTASELDKVGRDVIAAEGYGEYFTHASGHGIGVTVHERPRLMPLDNTMLQENMTFTLEPSVRIPDRFFNRVEDVFVVTPTGGVSLYNVSRHLYIVD